MPVQHDRVAIERPANLEVLALRDALCTGDFAAGLGMFGREGEQALDPKALHEVVFETYKGAAGAGVSLSPRSTAKLVIDAQALVKVRCDDVEATECNDCLSLALVRATEADVRASARHVRRDRHGPELSRV